MAAGGKPKRSLLAEFGADPQHEKKRQGHGERQQEGGKAYIAIAGGVAHRVVAEEVPGQQREDGEGSRDEKSEERRGEAQQQAGE